MHVCKCLLIVLHAYVTCFGLVTFLRYRVHAPSLLTVCVSIFHYYVCIYLYIYYIYTCVFCVYASTVCDLYVCMHVCMYVNAHMQAYIPPHILTHAHTHRSRESHGGGPDIFGSMRSRTSQPSSWWEGSRPRTPESSRKSHPRTDRHAYEAAYRSEYRHSARDAAHDESVYMHYDRKDRWVRATVADSLSNNNVFDQSQRRARSLDRRRRHNGHGDEGDGGEGGHYGHHYAGYGEVNEHAHAWDGDRHVGGLGSRRGYGNESDGGYVEGTGQRIPTGKKTHIAALIRQLTTALKLENEQGEASCVCVCVCVQCI
jgi:hypothetical protein